MSFKTTKSRVKRIEQGEEGFHINDGMTSYPRAMLHVLPECPANVRHQINWAISSGYLKAVSYVYDYEYTMDQLKS